MKGAGMKTSETLTGIADRLMDEAEVQNTQAGDTQANEVQRMINLASSKSLLTMAQILRAAAAKERAAENELAKRAESEP
jgi:hypothetical protein